MRLDLTMDVRAPVARFTRMADQAEHPERILKRWGGYLRAEAARAGEAAAGWPGLAESTRKRLEQTRTANVTAAGKVRASYARNLGSYLRLKARQGSAIAASDLAELGRLRSGEGASEGPQGRAVTRLRKQLAQAAAGKRVGGSKGKGGDKRKIAKHKLLGRLPAMTMFKIEGRTVRVMSLVPWSNVHNQGGSAGNGAGIPQRMWLDITAKHRAAMAFIALEQITGKGRARAGRGSAWQS